MNEGANKRRRSRRITVAAILVLALALLAGIAIAVATFVTPERALRFAQQALARSLSREVRIGSAQLALWPPFGIDARRVAISDPRGFAQGTMVSAERVRFRLSLWSLLARKLELSGVVVEGPRVRLWRDARGRANWDGLLRTKPGATGRSASAEFPFRDFRLRDGAAGYTETGKGPLFLASGVDLDLRRGPGDWTWSAHVKAWGTPRPLPWLRDPIDAEGHLRLSPRQGPWPLVVRAQSGDLRLDAQGRAGLHSVEIARGRLERNGAPAALEDLILRMSYDSLGVRVSRLSGRLGRSRFAFAGQLQPAPLRGSATASIDLADAARFLPRRPETVGGHADIAARFRGDGPNPAQWSVEGVANLSRVTWLDPSAGPGLSDLGGRIWFTGSDATVSGLVGRFGTVPFRLSARIDRPLALLSALDPHRPADAPLAVARFDLAGGEVDAARLFPPGKKLEMAPALVGEGTVRLSRLRAGRLDAQNVFAQVHYDRGVTRVDASSADAYGGRLTSTGSFDLARPDVPRYTVSLQASGMDAGRAMAAWTPFPDLLSGGLDLNLDLSSESFLPPVALRQLSASGLAKTVGGQITGATVLEEAARWTGLKDFRRLHFQDFLWKFRIVRGVVYFTDTLIRTGSGDFQVGGNVGLDGDLHVNVSAALPAARLSELPDYVRRASGVFSDREGRVLLDFTILGTVKSPRFAWRADRAAERLVQRIEEQLLGKLDPLDRALQDSLATAQTGIEDRLRLEAEAQRRRLEEEARRRQEALEDQAKNWLEDLLKPPPPPAAPPESAGPAPSRPETTAAPPPPVSDSSAAADTSSHGAL